MSSAPTSRSCSSSSALARRATLLALLLAAAGAAAVADGALNARLLLPTPVLQARARQVLSVAVWVENAGTDSRALAIETALPAGWRSLATEGELVLASGSSDIRILSVLVPQGSLAGDYAVAVRIRDTSDDAVSTELELPIHIPEELALRITVAEHAEFAIAGTDYELTYVVANTGNSRAVYDLDVQSEYAFPFTVDADGPLVGRELEAGAQETVRITVRTDRRIRSAVGHRVELTARLQGAPAEPDGLPRQWMAGSEVEVIPLSVGGNNLLVSVPGTAETAGSLDYDGGFSASLQETFTASGGLDEDARHIVELRLRKNVASDADLLMNPQDRYAIAYRGPLGGIRLGDQTYSLSPLLGVNRFGRGAGVAVNLAPLTVSGLYFKDVWNDPGRQDLGALVELSIAAPRREDVSLYHVGLTLDSPLADRLTLDLDQELSPLSGLVIGLDAAAQVLADRSLIPAVLARVQGDHTVVSYEARFVRAWPGFQGAYGDAQSIDLSGGLALLGSNLHLSAGFALTDGNLAMEATRETAERTRRISSGVKATLSGIGAEISGGWENGRRLDRLPPAQFDTWQNTLTASWQQELGRYSISVDARLDHVFDVLDGSTSLAHKHSLGLEYRPATDALYGLSLHYGRDLAADAPARHEIGWEIAAQRAWANTTIDGGAHNAYTIESSRLMEVIVGVAIGMSHTFAWGHTLSGRASLGLSEEAALWRPASALDLSYGVPVGIPVRRKADSVIVRGRVYHDGTGAPLPGVLVRTSGLAAITGKKGEFVFYLPRSGTHYLMVDPRDAAAALVPTRAVPVEISTTPGSVSTVDIALVEGATLAGSVVVYGFPGERDALARDGETQGDSPSPQRELIGGLGNVLVELSGPTETRRRLTGPAGDFLFGGLVPGSYTLTVLEGGIPSAFAVEQPTYSVTLASGERERLEIRVLQQRRRIRMLATIEPLVLDAPAEASSERTLTLGDEEGTEETAPASTDAPGGTGQ